MTWFGHIDCEKCGHRHPSSDDCQKRKALMAGIVPRVTLMGGKSRPLISTMENRMPDFRFEAFAPDSYGFVTPDGITVSNHMVKSMVDWARKVQAGEADGKDFAVNVAPVLRGLDQFLALGFDAKMPVRQL